MQLVIMRLIFLRGKETLRNLDRSVDLPASCQKSRRSVGCCRAAGTPSGSRSCRCCRTCEHSSCKNVYRAAGFQDLSTSSLKQASSLTSDMRQLTNQNISPINITLTTLSSQPLMHANNQPTTCFQSISQSDSH